MQFGNIYKNYKCICSLAQHMGQFHFSECILQIYLTVYKLHICKIIHCCTACKIFGNKQNIQTGRITKLWYICTMECYIGYICTMECYVATTKKWGNSLMYWYKKISKLDSVKKCKMQNSVRVSHVLWQGEDNIHLLLLVTIFLKFEK